MNNTKYDGQEQNEDESDEEMEEVEPRLKYVRMRNDLENILQNDAASCIAVHPKFLCLGSHWGMIHLLDHQGNNIRSKTLQAHTVAVNQISIDQNGDFIASCSDDGKVFIYGLYSTENNHNMSMGRVVKSIALDRNYYKTGSGRKFITGDNKLILYEKTFLSRIKPTILCEAEGGVRSIAWAGQLVAWASDTGVRIYDLNAKCSLGLINWKGSVDASPEHHRCNLRWSDHRTLLIGWVDTVRVCQIRKRSQHEMANRDLPEYGVDLVSTFQVDFYISGIAPLGNQLVLLGCLKEPDENGKSQRPMLHVVEPKYQEYTAVCANSLTLRGYKEYSCNDYHLDCLTDENRYFIVSPKDVVVANLYDADDRLEWLLTHGKFEQALETVTTNGGKDCKRHSLIYVGRVYLDHLLSRGRYDDAGKLCLKILGRDKELWEEEVYKFAKVHQLRSISSYLPRGDVTLDPSIYEMVLYEYLKMDPKGFLQLVKEWSPSLYTVAAVVNGVLEHLLTHDHCQNVLLEALAILYSHDGKYDKALAMYLKLRHPDVFQLIQKHQLYNSVYDMVEGLMDLDSKRAIQFFLEKGKTGEYKVPPDIVIEKLQNNHRYLYVYLDALDTKDMKESKGKYHGHLVRLYADYSRDKLLPLLRRSDNYPIQQALDICSKRQFYPEMVYLLGRIGNTSQALALMTRELNDMESAIKFCQEHDDNELWNDLVNYSLDKPEAITFLLQRIGTYMDPRLILQQISPSLEIPGLKKALIKMMCDYNLQVSVQAGCKKILSNDYFNLHEKLVRSQQKGFCTDDDQMCCACHRKIIIREPRNLVMFYCRHSFHEDCLPNLDLVILDELLKRLEVKHVVWCKDKGNLYYEVIFPVPSGDPCETCLHCLTEMGIGVKLNSIVSVIPTECTYNGMGNILSSNETASDYFDDKNAWKAFIESVRSKLTVQQVIDGVKSGGDLTFDYILLVLTADCLAALGLVENSATNVVAAMLVSPLMGPVMSLTFGTIIADRHLQFIGLKSLLLGIFLSIVFGFIFGLVLGTTEMPWGYNDWPTDEMKSRGNYRSLWMGVLWALPSGTGVAVALLQGSNGPLIGVAISASLLPPVVNCGLFWALGCIWLIYKPVKMPHIKGESYTDMNTSYIHVYTEYIPVEFFCNGIISACLTFVNVICIFITAILVLKIKEVAAPWTSTPELRRFWEQDIRTVREGNNSRGASNYSSIVSSYYDGIDATKRRSLKHTLSEALHEAMDDKTFRNVQRYSYGQYSPEQVSQKLGPYRGSVPLPTLPNNQDMSDDLAALDKLITALLGQSTSSNRVCSTTEFLKKHSRDLNQARTSSHGYHLIQDQNQSSSQNVTHTTRM